VIKTLILICAATLRPADCTTDTARAVVQGPEVVVCAGMAPQGLLAATAVRPRDEYVKTTCLRSENDEN
jgi:hypothetical protein